MRRLLAFIFFGLWLLPVIAFSAQPKPGTIILSTDYKLIKITGDLKTAPQFLAIGDLPATAISCQALEPYETERDFLQEGNLNFTQNATKHFFNTVSPAIDYIWSCSTPNNIGEIATSVVSTDGWHNSVYSEHLGEYAQGKAMTQLDNGKLTIIMGHKPCICAKDTKKCSKMMEAMRKARAEHWKMVSGIEKLNKNTSQETKNLLAKYNQAEKLARRKDPCDRNPEKAKTLLLKMQASLNQDMNSHKRWWWPF